MGVQVKADAFLELVDKGAEVDRLGTGFTFTEGPIWNPDGFLLFSDMPGDVRRRWDPDSGVRSEEHTSELQSHVNLVCRLLLEKKKKKRTREGVKQELGT